MKTTLVIFLLMLSTPSFALRISEARVYSEATSTSMEKCQVSSQSQVAAIESGLRSNRIGIAGKSSNNPAFYLSSVALELNASACAIFSRLEVQYHARVPVTFNSDRKSIFSTVKLCSEGTLITGPKYDLQARVNSTLKEFVDLCLSEIEKIDY